MQLTGSNADFFRRSCYFGVQPDFIVANKPFVFFVVQLSSEVGRDVPALQRVEFTTYGSRFQYGLVAKTAQKLTDAEA